MTGYVIVGPDERQRPAIERVITVTVVDTSDFMGIAAAVTRLGEYRMSNVQTFVASVEQACQDNRRGRNKPRNSPDLIKRIGRLNIIDHGNSRSFQIGTDRISHRSFERFRPQLAPLRRLFADDGWCHLQACNVAQDRELMQKLADMWGVRVLGGTGLTKPVYRVNTGQYVECRPRAGCELSQSQWGALNF